MDARQFAFLSRQPSTGVKTREHFWGMPKRGLAFLLANVMFWQPMWAQADGIVVATPGTSLGQAGNGVPIVNIATPNGTGLSHNQFVDYNVGTQGVILNNVGAQTGATQLGGIIVGNPNMTNRAAAQTILNEVVGGSPSQLRGYTEVAGQSARVIVANPYGISCNGCGFINTPRVTLTTGKPVLDNGRLDRFQVDQGSVTIDGAGLNANNVDSFEIITRSAKINAEIQAKNLTIVAGRNDVNAQTLNATARADDGSAKPQLAIDSSALGGMYAGAIKLVGTEAGVGVKLAGNLAASGGDIQIDANGHLSLAQTAAAGAINVNAASLETQGPMYAGTSLNVLTQGDLTNQQSLAARDSINLSASGQLTNNGIIEAGVNADNSRNGSGDVNVAAQTLTNNGHSVIASRHLSVSATTLNNVAGTLRSQQNLIVQLSGGLNNTQGLLSSEVLLSVSAASLANRLGSLSSAGQLSIGSSGWIDNQGGQLVTDAGLNLSSASLDNSQAGSISAKGALNLSTGAFNNNVGSLSGGSSLTLNAGPVTNQNGRIAGAGALNASFTALDQQGGQLFSNTSLTLDLNQGQLNNSNGLINAPILVLNNLNGVVNQGGEISSAQAFTLAANSLDNSNGRLLSNQTLTLRINQALSNVKGLIAAAALDVQAGSLDNSGGTLTSQAALNLKIDGQLSNQNTGRITAVTQLTIYSAALNNQNGTLFGSAIAVDFGTATGDLNNQGGLITTDGQLTITHLRDLNNEGGEISSAQSFSLDARTLDNSAGDLISNGQLTLNADTLINQNGLISGWQGLSVTGGSLDNRNTGTLSSRNGDVNVSLRGALLNGANGALVSQKALTVNAASLDNRSGILSSGTGQTLTVSGLLDNGQNGLINSGAALTLNAMAMANVGGSINAQQALTVNGTSLDNTGGTLAGNDAVTLTLLGTLTNTQGKLASAGPLLIQTSQTNNQGGQIVSQGLLTLLTGGLDNSHTGTLAANGPLVLTASGAVLNNDDGLIYSQTADVQLHAASLDNAAGTVQSKGALALTLTGDIDNRMGRLIAQNNDLVLNAGNVDNRGGVLSSLTGTVSAWLSGLLNNGQGGIVQGQSLDLTAQGGIDNSAGRLAAQTGDAVIHTSSFNNTSGGLYATGGINLTGSSLDNSNGQIAGDQIDLTLSGALSNRLGIVESGRTLSVSAASVDNQSGKLRALGTSGQTRFQIGGLFDNQNGTLESANTDLILATGNFLNANGTLLHVGTGTFDIDSRQAMAAGGSLVTRGALSLSGNGLSNSSVIQAGRLSLNLTNFNQTASGQLLASDSLVGSGSNWNNDGLIASDGSINLTLGGTYAGNGRLSASGDLTLNSDQVSLSSTASIAGGGTTTLNVGGPLINYGRLTSSRDLIVNAGSVSNYGTLGSAQALTVTTGSLLNDHGLIFSGGDMALRVADFTNSYADVYSLAKLSIDRDGAGGWANSIINSSSSIQSDGAMSLAASTIQNIRALLTVNDAGIYTAQAYEITCIEGVNAGDCSGKQNHAWEIVTREKLEVTAASAASSITAGGNLSLTGGDLLNASSTIATSGNLAAVLNNLTNSGVETSDTEYTRQFMSERTNNASNLYNAADAITDQYWYQSAHYDPNNLGGIDGAIANFIAMTEREYPLFATTTKLSTGDQTYAAVIQAAGAVNITTQNNFDNSTVRAGYTYVGSGAKTNTDTAGSAYSTRVSLNQQLPPDLAQQQVNPTTLPGFNLPTGQNGLFRLSGQDSSTGSTGPQSWTLGGASLLIGQHQNAGTSVARVQGVPTSSGGSHPQKYLIETNPVLTDLKQFMSSDYLLGALGYDPDQSARRLGDGFYEQTLIQQAIVARTGQRFLEGETSDEAQFRYLMDNAIASKEALSLSVGISLTAEQVAALTHDIVWLESEVIDGQTVLVPVLYLANANNRLAPNGSLIQGSDMTLIAGNNLNNAGTLKATNGLSATAGNNLVNSGLINAGGRLDLLAGNDLTNKAGGVIAGRDVSVTSRNGDIINERTVTSHQSTGNGYSQQRDFVDNAGRIEATNDLTVSAGRDVNNVGGVLQSGRNTTIGAGRDVNITSAEQIVSNDHGVNLNDLSIKHYGASVTTGQDLSINAGRDLTVVGSQLTAGGNAALNAGNDLTLASAADEEHSYSKTKKVTSQEDHVQQIGSSLTAGGNVTLNAGNDLTLSASKVGAQGDVSLDAERDINVLSATNEDSSFYSKKTQGSFGRSKSEQRASYESTNVASVIEAGHNLTLNTSQSANGALSLDGGRDVNIVGSQLKAGNDLLVGAKGNVTILSGEDTQGSSSQSSKSGFGGLSKRSQSQMQTSTTQVASELSGGHDVVIVAGNDINLSASNISAGNNAELYAGVISKTGDINLVAANDTTSSQSQKQSSKTGFSTSGGMLSVASDQQGGTQSSSSTSVGSQITADRDVTLQAARDINVVGSGVSAGRNASLDAGRDVTVVAAENTQSNGSWNNEGRTGIALSSDSNGVSAFVGKEQVQGSANTTTHTAVSSVIQAGNDLTINAKRDIQVTGSDLLADNDVNLTAGRNIGITAAAETRQTEQQQEESRQGLSASLNHNLGNTKDALNGAGKGDNGVSKGSSILKALDAVSQFLGGPTADARLGSSSQSSSQQVVEDTNRSSTLNAGRDLNLNAGNNVSVSGSQLNAGRDINVKGRDIVIDVAQDGTTQDNQQDQSVGGIHGGTSGGFKLGVGGSHGVASGDSNQGTSTASQLGAGRDINLDASNDLTLIGAQVQAGRDIDLAAGNDLTIRSAQNASSSNNDRHNLGGEAGIAVGPGGIGVYGSANVGQGNLTREGEQQQEAYIYAGNQLRFTSGKDTTVAGAELRGNEVIGRVGGNLLVSSVPDTGNVQGKEYDVSGTVTVGFGGSVSGSVGYGETNGKTNWVQHQTSITGKNKVDIRTENHTQIDGALIAADNGNLKLDTDTLGFSDIAGQDKEHGYYLNVGGTYGGGGNTQQDSSQVGKGDKGQNGWSVSGYDATKDREQIARATVGAGEIIVRGDKTSGQDSTAGLNRDVSKGYEVTKDESSRTDLYVTKSSLEAASHPVETLTQWKDQLLKYPEQTAATIAETLTLLGSAATLAEQAWRAIQAQRVSLDSVPSDVRAQLGDERALAIAQNFVRNGMDPVDVSKLSSTDLIALGRFADLAGQFNQNLATCQAQGQCTVENGQVKFSGTTTVDANGEKNISVTQGKALTSGQSFLLQVNALRLYISTLLPEDAQYVMLGAQALMGPAKAVVGLAGNQILNSFFGPQIQKAKENIGIGIAEPLVPETADELRQSNDEYKDYYQQRLSKDNGNSYVQGATFLLDIALGTTTTVAGGLIATKVAGGREIAVSGAKGTIPENMSPIGAGRSGAFNEAKRQSGIPTSQQPSRVLPNVDKRGNPQPGKIYEFDVPAPGGGVKTVRIRDDAGGHDFGSGNSQNRGSHFNDETGNHYDY
jgi:filamentous hemagglutinin